MFGVNTVGTVNHHYQRGLKIKSNLIKPIGRPTILTELEDNALLQEIFLRENLKRPMTAVDIVEYVFENFNKKVSSTWPQQYVKQHNRQLIYMVAFPMEEERLELKIDIMEKHCDDVDVAICQYDWRMIFNWDESGAEQIKDIPKMVLVSKRNENQRIYFKSSRPQGHITIVPGIALDGDDLPPLIMISDRTVDDDMNIWGLPQGHLGYIVSTKTGFINEDCLEKYINEVAGPAVETKRRKLGLQGHRALILQDNMSSHISMKVKKALGNFDIDTYEFPAHSSHLTQPLDNGAFSKMKKEMKKPFKTSMDWTERTERIMKIPTSLEKCTGKIQNKSYFRLAGFDLDLNIQDFPLRFNREHLMQKNGIPMALAIETKAVRNKTPTKRMKVDLFKSSTEKKREKRKAEGMLTEQKMSKLRKQLFTK